MGDDGRRGRAPKPFNPRRTAAARERERESPGGGEWPRQERAPKPFFSTPAGDTAPPGPVVWATTDAGGGHLSLSTPAARRETVDRCKRNPFGIIRNAWDSVAQRRRRGERAAIGHLPPPDRLRCARTLGQGGATGTARWAGTSLRHPEVRPDDAREPRPGGHRGRARWAGSQPCLPHRPPGAPKPRSQGTAQQ